MDPKRRLKDFKGSSGRLLKVDLLYKKFDDVIWMPAANEKNTVLQNVDFLDATEEAYHYATVNWDFTKQNIQDGRYNIIVKASYSNLVGAPAEYNAFSTDVIESIFDRKPPTLYRQTSIEKSRNVINVVNEIIINFSEDIKCSKPYAFALKNKKLDNDNFLILCE